MPYKITINNQPDLEGWASKLDFGEYEEHELGHYYLLELLKDYDVKDLEITISLTNKGN